RKGGRVAWEPLAFLMAWFIPLVIVGYPIAGASTIFVPFVEPTTVTYGYRGIVAALSALAIVAALVRNQTPIFPMALTVFLLAYLVRLYVGTFAFGISRADLASICYVGRVPPPAPSAFLA